MKTVRRSLVSAGITGVLFLLMTGVAAAQQATGADNEFSAKGMKYLAAGIAISLGALRLPRAARLVLAAVLLMAATVLVNLAPPNPYFAETLKVWEQGHFLNFNGLTRLVSAAWPFAALGYLVYLASARLREPLR